MLCLGFTVNAFLFLLYLPGGSRNPQPFDWRILTSFAPAYLPSKIPIVLYVAAGVLIIIGWISKAKGNQPLKNMKGQKKGIAREKSPIALGSSPTEVII